MITAICDLESLSPYSQSRFHDTPKHDQESPDDHERRTWKNRLHIVDGEVVIPPMAFKSALQDAARHLGIKIPGRGASKYTKHFTSGIMIVDALETGVAADDVVGEWLFLNADGVRGSAKRVKRCMPRVDSWRGTLTVHVLDPVITEPVFNHHLDAAGTFIGVGRFRPQNGGFYGRFKVNGVEWVNANVEHEVAQA